MQKIKILAIGALLLSGLALAACSTASPLTGTSWALVELGGAAPLPGVAVTLVISDEGIGGSDGCNHYSGSASIQGNGFGVDPNLISTLMACEDPIMRQADAYRAALLQAETYRLEGGQLALLGADGNPLAVFRAE
jgi:heat shock protein HslJ